MDNQSHVVCVEKKDNDILIDEPKGRDNEKSSQILKQNSHKKNIFTIHKDSQLSHIDSQEGVFNSNDSRSDCNESTKRVSAFSKVNFTKLRDSEKQQRFKNLSMLVKKLKKKVRILENKFKLNAGNTLNKYIEHVTGKKNCSNKNYEINIDKLCTALKILHEYNNFENEDQKYVIENLIKIIADGDIELDSINYNKICTQIRLFLGKDKINYTHLGKKITFFFQEREINVTKKEYLSYSKFKDRENIIRTIFGIDDNESNGSYPGQITFTGDRKLPSVNEDSVAEKCTVENSNRNLVHPNGGIDILHKNVCNNNVQRMDLLSNLQSCLELGGMSGINPVQLLMFSNGALQNALLSSFYLNLMQNIINQAKGNSGANH